MDDIWLCVDEEDDSNYSFTYSDKVDSETEAELYGMIHHQENLHNASSPYKKDPDSDKSLEISNSNNCQTKDASCKESNNIESNCSISSLKSLHTSLNHSYINKTVQDKSSFKKNLHNFNTPLKRKSDSEHDSCSSVILLSEQDSASVIKLSEDAEVKYSSKALPEFISPKKKVCKNSPKKNILKQKTATVLDSSDSDESIIWKEKEDEINNDLQTNLSHDIDIISISSDSDISDSNLAQMSRKEMVQKNESPFLTNRNIANNSEDNLGVSSNFDSPSTKSLQLKNKEMIQKNVSLASVRIKDDFKDLWYIDDEDRYRYKHRYNRPKRYHLPIEKPCSNCGEKGHLAKSCTVLKEMKCFICGGAHSGSQCPNRMCGKCYHVGHDSKFCWMKFVSFCRHCKMKGHVKKDCPDLWRRYHLTTEPVTIIVGRPLNQDKAIYCFNCGWAGHFGAVCQEPRKGPFTTWPCVVSYNNSDDMIQRKDNERNTNLMDLHQNQRNTNCVDVHPNQRHVNLIDVHHNQRNNLKYSHQTKKPRVNTIEEFIAERRNENKKLKNWQFFKQRSLIRKQNKLALREKDFPRTPNRATRTPNRATIEKYNEGMPESVELELNNQLKKKKRRRARKRNRQLIKLSENN